MNWNDWLAAIASAVAILAPVLLWISWSLRRWASQHLLPTLTNDGISGASYAHQAMLAAEEAKNAAVDAKQAALEAKSASLETHQLFLDFLREEREMHK